MIQQVVRTKIAQHRSRIRNKIKEALQVYHCIDKGHDSNFKFLVFDKYVSTKQERKDVDRELQKKETYWIHRLIPSTPRRINLVLDFSTYI